MTKSIRLLDALQQDYLYLRDCIGFKYGSYFKPGLGGTSTQAAPRIGKTIGYAELQRQACVQLGIPNVEQTRPTRATAKYMDFLNYGLLAKDYIE